MPLCTLKLSTKDFDRAIFEVGLGTSISQKEKDLCKAALDIIVKKLQIPDENDVEMSFMHSLTDESSIEVSFTCGGIEYPDFSNDIFDPKKELIQEACEEIQEIARNYPFGIKSTTIEAWRGTTFEIISPEDKIETNFLRSEFNTTVKAETTIITSSRLNESYFSGSKEYMPFFSGENCPDRKIGKEISTILPNGKVEHHLSGNNSDTDIGITIDFPGIKEIPENIRKDIAFEVKQSIGRNAEGKSATIWIRPGSPEVYQSNSLE